jgi:hypothetical protein
MMSLARSAGAVLVGLLVVLVLGLLLSALVGVLAWALSPGGAPALTATSPVILSASLAVQLIASVAGGYQAGKVAGHAELAHGFAVGVVETLGGVALSRLPIFQGGGLPAWYEIASWILSIPAACAGGMLAGWRVPARTAREA